MINPLPFQSLGYFSNSVFFPGFFIFVRLCFIRPSPMRIICLLLAFVLVVTGTKRDRTEMEADSLQNRISDIINTVAGRAGSKIDIVRSLVKDDEELSYYFLSLGQFEVEAFEIMTSNPALNSDEMAQLLNTNIDVSRTVSKRAFDTYRVSFWSPIVLKVDDQDTAHFIGSNTQILTNDDHITYLQLSDEAWDRFVLAWLLRKDGPREFPRPEMPQVQPPTPIDDLETILPPLARQYVLQSVGVDYVYKDASNSILPLQYFDTRSVLFRKMREYALTFRSLTLLDREAVSVLREASWNPDAEVLAEQINVKFNSTYPPAFNLLYTAERLRVWLTPYNMFMLTNSPDLPPSHFMSLPIDMMENWALKRFFNCQTKWPRRVSPEEVRLEWEQHERNQSAGGPFVGIIDTGIRRRPFSVDFKVFPQSDETSADLYLPISTEAKRRVLRFLSEKDTHGMRPSTLEKALTKIFTETGAYRINITQYISYLRSFRYIDEEIANELARLNRLRIATTPESIIAEATKRTDISHTTPENIHIFYKLMMESIRARPGDRAYETYTNSAGESLAYIRHDIWREKFILPRL